MNKNNFSVIRKKLKKTQKQLSILLGVSLKTIHSYEQGWRVIPTTVERQLYFFRTKQIGKDRVVQPCWERKNCTSKEDCPTYEFQSGDLCWFFCGTRCDCTESMDCKEKLKTCRKCEILIELCASAEESSSP